MMYLQFLPNEYVLRYKKGRRTAAGRGLSFYCFTKGTTVAVVPVSVQEADFIYEEQTCDFQNVTVQGQLAYRVADCEKIAEQMNFTVRLKDKEYYDEPIDKLSKRVVKIERVGPELIRIHNHDIIRHFLCDPVMPSDRFHPPDLFLIVKSDPVRFICAIFL